MKRRDVIALLGGAPMVWQFAAHAQQPALPVIGWLSSRSPDESAYVVAAFRQSLKENGYVEGQNLHIAFRWAGGEFTRLPALAADLVAQRVAVIAAVGGEDVALAAKVATTTIPVVFVVGGDATKHGLVASLNRPGGNITGVTLFSVTLGTKRLELLRELVPKARVIALLVNPNNINSQSASKELSAAASAIGVEMRVLTASTDRDIEAAFANLVQQRADALLVNTDPFFSSQRDYLIALAARHSIPAIYDSREQVAAGGLISYGASYTDTYRQAGIYVARILHGGKPADLPVLQPTKFELVINLKTAKVLGLTIPQSVLLRADEVIE